MNRTGTARIIIRMMAAITLALLFGISVAPLGVAHAAAPRNLFLIHREGKFGYIDQTGAVVIPPRFTAAFSFAEGRAMVRIDGKWGYIDETGAQVIGPQFDFVSPFSHGLAYVTMDRTDGYIDPTGHFVWQQTD